MIDVLQFPSAAKPVWDKLYITDPSQTPFSSFEWHTLWFTYLGTAFDPYTLAYNRSVLFPFAKQSNHVIFSGGTDISDYMDAIGPPQLTHEAWNNVLPFLREQNHKTLTLHNVPETSPTYTFFSDIKTRNYHTISITHEDTTPIISFPGMWDDYMNSLERKARHELKRKIRKFEREYPGTEVAESGNIESEMNILLTLMKRSEEKRQFLTDGMEQFFLHLPAVLPERTRLLLLRVGDQIPAAVVYFSVGDSFYLYNSGFDETNFSGAGFYLKAKSIQYAFDHGYKHYNFLQGSERYKYELGGKDFVVHRITINL